MKRYAIIAVALLSATTTFAQVQGDPADGNTAAGRLGIDTAQQDLKEVSVDKFEQEGYWRASISSDSGFISARLFEGSPAGKVPIPEEANFDPPIPDAYVLGARVDFLRRSQGKAGVAAA